MLLDTTYEPLWVGKKLGKHTSVVLLEENGGGHPEGHRKMSGVSKDEAIKTCGATGANTSKQAV